MVGTRPDSLEIWFARVKMADERSRIAQRRLHFLIRERHPAQVGVHANRRMTDVEAQIDGLRHGSDEVAAVRGWIRLNAKDHTMIVSVLADGAKEIARDREGFLH